MTYKKTGKLMDTFIKVSFLIVIIGIIFKVLNYSNSNLLLVAGMSSAASLAYYEVKRLKKVIDVLTKTLQ